MDEDLDRIVERCLTDAQRDAPGARDAEQTRRSRRYSRLSIIRHSQLPDLQAVAEHVSAEQLMEGRRTRNGLDALDRIDRIRGGRRGSDNRKCAS